VWREPPALGRDHQDEHRTFPNYQAATGEPMKELETAGCLGDVL
jgi:hypothetical protein